MFRRRILSSVNRGLKEPAATAARYLLRVTEAVEEALGV
jgi:hypothetical protein